MSTISTNRAQRRAGLTKGQWAAQRRTESKRGVNPKRWNELGLRAKFRTAQGEYTLQQEHGA